MVWGTPSLGNPNTYIYIYIIYIYNIYIHTYIYIIFYIYIYISQKIDVFPTSKRLTPSPNDLHGSDDARRLRQLPASSAGRPAALRRFGRHGTRLGEQVLDPGPLVKLWENHRKIIGKYGNIWEKWETYGKSRSYGSAARGFFRVVSCVESPYF